MDFGKLASVDHVRFEMPTPDPKTGSVLTGTRSAGVRVYIGGPVWICPSWIGRVYPKGVKDSLRAYGEQLNSIELNSSFYRIPDRLTVQKWRDSVPEDFRFAPKLHQSISHFENIGLAKANLRTFWHAIEGFEDRLGICFLQLSPHFTFQSLGLLKTLLEQIPDPSRLAVEFRHPSWFQGGRIRGEAYDLLQGRGISTVISDVAGRRDVLHASLTTRKVLVRFVGNELHPTDFERIDAWVERLNEWIEGGLEELYFFMHQPTEREVPELIHAFVNRLRERTGIDVRTWAPIVKVEIPPPPQMALF